LKWLAAEDELPDPMAGLQPPHVADKPVPVFTGQELSRLERACAGHSFEQRRDAAIIAVLRASGICLSELGRHSREQRADAVPEHPACSLESDSTSG